MYETSKGAFYVPLRFMMFKSEALYFLLDKNVKDIYKLIGAL